MDGGGEQGEAVASAAEEHPRWYAVLTKPRRERLADLNLRRQGYWTFFPLKRVRRRRRRPGGGHVVETVERPYLARYLFVAFRGRRGESAYQVNNTIGVTGMVYFGEGPLPIPNGFIDALMADADAAGLIEERDEVTRAPLPEGTRFYLAGNSAFDGQIARVVLDAGSRLLVFLEAYGRARQIHVPPAMIGKLVDGEAEAGAKRA